MIRIKAILIIVTLSILAFSSLCSAKNTPKGFSFEPLTKNLEQPGNYIITAQPGTIVEDYLTMMNFTDKDVEVTLSALDADQQDNGKKVYKLENATQETVGNWISFDQDTYYLPNHSSKIVKYRAQIPADIESDTYIGGLTMKITNITNATSGILTSLRLLQSVYIEVSDNPRILKQLPPPPLTPLQIYFFSSFFLALIGLAYVKASQK